MNPQNLQFSQKIVQKAPDSKRFLAHSIRDFSEIPRPIFFVFRGFGSTKRALLNPGGIYYRTNTTKDIRPRSQNRGVRRKTLFFLQKLKNKVWTLPSLCTIVWESNIPTQI